MIALISTGGTIMSKAKDAKSCHDYTPSNDALGEILSNLELDYECFELCNIDSSNMSEDVLISLGKLLQKVQDRGFSAAVIMHGTDTMEESAYFINCLDLSIPVVFTGAMRPASAIGFDGKKNLLNSIMLAKIMSKNQEVLICMNDKIFYASKAYKQNSTNVDAFAAQNQSLTGFILGEKVVLNTTLNEKKLKLKLPCKLSKVGLIYSHIGLDKEIVDFYEQNNYQALVVAGFGSGTINELFLQRLLSSKLIIILATRVPTGGLIRLGKYPKKLICTQLNPLKARLLASLCDINTLQTVFEDEV